MGFTPLFLSQNNNDNSGANSFWDLKTIWKLHQLHFSRFMCSKGI